MNQNELDDVVCSLTAWIYAKGLRLKLLDGLAGQLKLYKLMIWKTR